MRRLLLAGLLWLLLPLSASTQEIPWTYYRQCCFFMFEHDPPTGNPPADSLYVYARDVAGVTTFMVRRSDGVEIALETGVGGGAPTTSTYITQTPDAGLSAEQALSLLGTGILKNTTTTGVLSIAVAGDFPTLNQNTTGTAAALAANGGNCGGNNFALGVDATGVGECAQPSFANLSGSIAPTQIPNPGATTKGGIEAETCGGTDKISAIGIDGVPVCSADVSGDGTTPTGTGYRHVTAGVEDAAAVSPIPDADIPNNITIDLATLATTATTANAGDSATAFSSAGTVEVARGGTGAAPGADDQVLVSDSTSAATWRAVPSCSNPTTSKVLYDTATNTWSCGTDQTAAGGPTTLVSTTLQSDAVIATYTAITGLSFTPAASTNYLIDCYIIYTSSAATTGINFAWDTPASPTGIWMTGHTKTVATGANEGFSQNSDNVGTSTSAAVITVQHLAYLSTLFRNGSTSATMSLGFTPETANSVSVIAGSVCQYRTF